MLTIFRFIFGALVALKTLQLTARASISTEGGIDLSDQAFLALPLGATVLVCVGFFVLGKGIRLAALAILSGFLVFVFAFDFYNHHTYLIITICAIFALGVSVPQLLKIQLTIVYAFAALTKINETYLSGSELYSSMVQAAVWQAVFRDDPSPKFLMIVSAASIVVEAFLAVALWFARTRGIALVVGLCFHAGLVIAVTGGFDLFADLSIYGGLILALYLPFFQDELDPLVGRRTGSTASVRDAASSPTGSF
jgi:hypothetical protein